MQAKIHQFLTILIYFLIYFIFIVSCKHILKNTPIYMNVPLTSDTNAQTLVSNANNNNTNNNNCNNNLNATVDSSLCSTKQRFEHQNESTVLRLWFRSFPFLPDYISSSISNSSNSKKNNTNNTNGAHLSVDELLGSVETEDDNLDELLSIDKQTRLFITDMCTQWHFIKFVCKFDSLINNLILVGFGVVFFTIRSIVYDVVFYGLCLFFRLKSMVCFLFDWNVIYKIVLACVMLPLLYEIGTDFYHFKYGFKLEDIKSMHLNYQLYESHIIQDARLLQKVHLSHYWRNSDNSANNVTSSSSNTSITSNINYYNKQFVPISSPKSNNKNMNNNEEEEEINSKESKKGNKNGSNKKTKNRKSSKNNKKQSSKSKRKRRESQQPQTHKTMNSKGEATELKTVITNIFFEKDGIASDVSTFDAINEPHLINLGVWDFFVGVWNVMPSFYELFGECGMFWNAYEILLCGRSSTTTSSKENIDAMDEELKQEEENELESNESVPQRMILISQFYSDNYDSTRTTMLYCNFEANLAVFAAIVPFLDCFVVILFLTKMKQLAQVYYSKIARKYAKNMKQYYDLKQKLKAKTAANNKNNNSNNGTNNLNTMNNNNNNHKRMQINGLHRSQTSNGSNNCISSRQQRRMTKLLDSIATKRDNCKYYFRLKTLYLHKLKLLRRHSVIAILITVIDLILIVNYDFFKLILHYLSLNTSHIIAVELYSLMFRICLIQWYICPVFEFNNCIDKLSNRLIEFFEHLKLFSISDGGLPDNSNNYRFDFKTFGYNHSWMNSESVRFETFEANLTENLTQVIESRQEKKKQNKTDSSNKNVKNGNKSSNQTQSNDAKKDTNATNNSSSKSKITIESKGFKIEIKDVTKNENAKQNNNNDTNGTNSANSNINNNNNNMNNNETKSSNNNKLASNITNDANDAADAKIEEIIEHYYGTDAKKAYEKFKRANISLDSFCNQNVEHMHNVSRLIDNLEVLDAIFGVNGWEAGKREQLSATTPSIPSIKDTDNSLESSEIRGPWHDICSLMSDFAEQDEKNEERSVCNTNKQKNSKEISNDAASNKENEKNSNEKSTCTNCGGSTSSTNTGSTKMSTGGSTGSNSNSNSTGSDSSKCKHLQQIDSKSKETGSSGSSSSNRKKGGKKNKNKHNNNTNSGNSKEQNENKCEDKKNNATTTTSSAAEATTGDNDDDDDESLPDIKEAMLWFKFYSNICSALAALVILIYFLASNVEF